MRVLTAWRLLLSRRARLLGIVAVASAAVFVFAAHAPLPRWPARASLHQAAVAVNSSKLGLFIENRPLPFLAPLTLHFMAVLPPDWPVLFLGSEASIASINNSAAIRNQVRDGRLALRPIPANMSTTGQEMISRFLTTPWLYETAIAPAEWLLVFQTDSMLCANSRLSVDDFLAYDWVGAPWSPESDWGGNGGLSLRRASRILNVLRREKREHDSDPEDVWLTQRLANLPGARPANGSVSLTFSGENFSGVPERADDLVLHNGHVANNDSTYIKGYDDWRDGFYEPMGYHTGGSGIFMPAGIWGSPENRAHIWNYCPEVKMTLNMDFARYVPGECGASW